MEQVIRKILDEVKSGCIFDSHFVIDQLIRQYSDEYLNFICSLDIANKKTSLVHSSISKEIAKFKKEGLIKRLPNESWSKNIHGIASNCAAWLKIQ